MVSFNCMSKRAAMYSVMLTWFTRCHFLHVSFGDEHICFQTFFSLFLLSSNALRIR